MDEHSKKFKKIRDVYVSTKNVVTKIFKRKGFSNVDYFLQKRMKLLNSLAKITVVGNMEPMCVLIFSAVLIASFFTNLLYFIFFHFFLFFQQPRFIKCELPHKENFSLLEKKTNHVLVVTAHTSNVYFFLSHNPNFIWQLTTDVTRVQFWWP